MVHKKKSLSGVIDKQILFIVISVIFLAVVVDVFMNFLMQHKEFNDQTVAATFELGAVRTRLEERSNTNFSLIHGMAAFISSHPDMDQKSFEKLAGNLLKRSTILKNMAAAPDFIIRFMIPLEGNEKALGLDYRRVPDQWAQALAAKETGRMILAGPLKLVQGGRGLIARVPVFIDDNGAFWGLVSAVMDFDALLSQTGLTSPSQDLKLAIRSKGNKDVRGEVFWGDPGLFDARAKAVVMDISIPSGSWQMAGVPKKGWVSHSAYRWMIHLLVTLIALLVLFSVIQQKQNSLKMIETDNQLKAMSRSIHDALVMVDSQDRITFWNPAAVCMFGYTEAEMLGKKFHETVTLPEDVAKAHHGLKHFSKTGEGPVMNTTIEMTAVRKSGEAFPVERSVAPFKLGGQWCAVGSMRDITVRKQHELQLKEFATIDALTGLSNRRHFLELSAIELKKAVRYRKTFCLIMFDIDYFKKINDTYGHDAGDRVLQNVADTVKKVFRESDIAGRIGGEEFAVTMPETELIPAIHAAERLRIAMTTIQVKSGNDTIKVAVSVGVAQWDGETKDIARVIKNADEHLYEAKRNGRNRVVPSNAIVT